MKQQNFKNHSQFVPMYHYVGAILLLATFVGSFVNYFHSEPSNKYSASLLIAVTFLSGLGLAFARVFSLKAQDRAIRAEENLRYFVLSDKLLPSSLSVPQIVALRFASDPEFVSLVERAVAENLSPTQIKQSIKEWRGDYYRV